MAPPSDINIIAQDPEGPLVAFLGDGSTREKLWTQLLPRATVNLIGMIVSDSGLASASPEWWNSSIMGCILIGLQPRGGWQVVQRSVQWGKDGLTNVFGVSCSKPALYAYFACSIRNRLEVWESNAWKSPMEGSTEWKAVGRSALKRPTKLIDGSRGGQGFLCSLLRPREGDSFSIEDQARMQLLSVVLTAAGLMDPKNLTGARLKEIMRDDFELSDRLGVIFHPLRVGLIFGQLVTLSFTTIIVYATFGRNSLRGWAPYLLQLSSQILWAVGAISLLMLGGNPRVRIVDKPIPSHVEDRLGSKKAMMDLDFGAIHGPVYVPTGSNCTLSTEVVRDICQWDLELQRPWAWKLDFVWSSGFLIISILLQVAYSNIATVGSESISILILMSTALSRGWGISGPEEWLIPRRKMRRGTNYGASLVGRMVSRDK